MEQMVTIFYSLSSESWTKDYAKLPFARMPVKGDVLRIDLVEFDVDIVGLDEDGSTTIFVKYTAPLDNDTLQVLGFKCIEY